MPLTDYMDAGICGLSLQLLQRSIEIVKFWLEFLRVQRTADSVFNNRDSGSGKVIKPHDVEG